MMCGRISCYSWFRSDGSSKYELFFNQKDTSESLLIKTSTTKSTFVEKRIQHQLPIVCSVYCMLFSSNDYKREESYQVSLLSLCFYFICWHGIVHRKTICGVTGTKNDMTENKKFFVNC